MSAKIVKLPERTYRPDLAFAFEIVDDQERDVARIYGLAKLSLNAIDAHNRRGDMSPKATQDTANAMMVAAVALLTVLGVPRNELEQLWTEPG